jgi:hypothetical protein
MSTEKPYKIIQGTQNSLAAFEAEVAKAIEAGYTLASDLLAKTVGSEIHFFQPVILEEAFMEEEEEEEEED